MADTRSFTSATSSGKRKRDSSMVFYAVKVGRKPGVYPTWNEANQQIQGFKGAVFKKFSTHAEAEAMVNGTSSATPKSSKTKYYAVANGHVPGVYTDYTAVQAQLKGATGVKHKAFATQGEAQAYVDQHKRDKSTAISLQADQSDLPIVVGSKSGESQPKKHKKENAPSKLATANENIIFEPGLGPLPPNAEDGFDPTIKLDLDTGAIRSKTNEELDATKPQPTGDFTGPIVVYTDGSSLCNGRATAVAGIGVFFGPRDSRNISEPLRGDRQTNQRAELVAVARALDHIPLDRSAEIVTDSNYAIKCLTEWFHKWEGNAWRNAAGKPVENRDLIEPIIARIRERDCCRAKTMFRWIKGHANDAGNNAADELAVQGSRLSTPELRAKREFSLTLNTPTRLHYFKEQDKAEGKQTKSTTRPGHHEASTPRTQYDHDEHNNEPQNKEESDLNQFIADIDAEQNSGRAPQTADEENDNLHHLSTDDALAENRLESLLSDELAGAESVERGQGH